MLILLRFGKVAILLFTASMTAAFSMNFEILCENEVILGKLSHWYITSLFGNLIDFGGVSDWTAQVLKYEGT